MEDKNIREERPSNFRRKEDQTRYELLEKMISLLKWSIILVIVILIFFYKLVSNQLISETRNYELLEEINKKIAFIESKNFAITSEILIPGNCMVCHKENTASNLKLKPGMTLVEFKNYIRGEVMNPANIIMPKFDEETISNHQIEKIYNYLKYIKQ